MSDEPADGRLRGARVAVTGAASGIGAAIASAAAAEGAEVLWLDRDPRVADVAGGRGRSLVGDVADPEFAAAVAEACAGTLHHLVLAAGIQRRTTAIDIDDGDWEQLLAVNLTGAFRLARSLAPALRASAPSSLLFVSSISATRAIPGIIPYGVIKAGISHLVRGLAVELGPDGVRVNAIAPGYVDTAMTADRLRDPDDRRRIEAGVPLGRIADPVDMAGPALFLMSAEASYVTGQILGVDGGYGLAP